MNEFEQVIRQYQEPGSERLLGTVTDQELRSGTIGQLSVLKPYTRFFVEGKT